MKKHFFYSFATILTALLLMSNGCDKSKNKDNTTELIVSDSIPLKKEVEMLSFQFNNNYSDLWKAVDSLQNLGLYKSALEVVNTIFEAAQKDNNAPQVVKSVIHKMKYNSYLSEDDYVVALAELNHISQTSSFPLKQIIHSVTAEVYWGFYQSNRWKFLNRTQTINFVNEDIRTWDLNKIADQVNKHYMLSLNDSDKLQRANISNFSEILVEHKETEKQRPTLYDFLAHRALNYFESTESSLTRPADKYLVSGKNFFGDANEFLNVSTVSEDSLSNALYAVKIFKVLTKFHLNDISPEAIIDIELKRLKFSLNHSSDEAKNIWYIAALEKLAEKYKNQEGYAEIRYYCAQYYNSRNENAVIPEENKWDKKKAIEICNEAIEKFPKSFGASQCENLKGIINNKSISFISEIAYQPGNTGKILMNYQNLDSVYFRLVKVNWDYYLKNRNYGEGSMKDLLSKPIVEEWNKQLNNPGDYRSHSTELLISPKEKGQYVLLASPNKDFRLDNNAIAYSSFWMTNLSYNHRSNNDGTYDIVVTDRETGVPLKNVKGTVYISKYNYVSRNYDIKKQETYTSDENGMFVIRSKAEYRSIYIDLESNGEHYNEANQLYQYKPYSSPKAYSTTYFFTDRNIYRPGQTVYFKGIKVRHDGESHTLETNKLSVVTFYDANRQKVADLRLTTNEYGTISGSFTAPSGLLNGQMHIEDANGSKYFSVEEYKRPKFEVEFEPITGVYKIGQQVKMTGTAKAYSGANIDGATVQYRITRSSSFPSWIYYRWGHYPHAKTVEIKKGSAKTDENGVFKIDFEATEDPSIDKKYYPYYSYSITADVTDITGETHSSKQYVIVGYNAMSLSLGINGTMERNDKNRFKITTANLNGEKVEATGNISVTKLIENDRLYRTSLWEKPDMQEISEEEYRQLFPHDTYNNENDITKLKRGEKVFETSFNTALSDSIDLVGMNIWKPGRYVIESTCVDSFGENVQDIQYIVLLDKNETKNPINEVWSFTPLKAYCQPGEKAEFLISSGAADLKVLYEIEHKGIIVSQKYLTLSSSQQKISIPIEEKHRGSITIHFSTVKFGRTHTVSQPVIVPYSNKELDITFETFRDKLLPGQQEEWRIKIKGPKGEKVAAEMLATMYDASLDAFVANSFYMQIYNSYYSNKYWESNSFSSNTSDLYYKDWNSYYAVQNRTYDYLNWWGYNRYFYDNSYRYKGSYYDYDREDGDAMNYAYTATMASGSVALEEISSNEQTISRQSKNSESQNNRLSAGEAEFSEKLEDKEGAGSGKDGKMDKNGLSTIQARSNMNETAFFMPQLVTNEKGEVIIKFTIPESLTKWKFLGMAHTKDLKVGYIQKELVTQKELMVVPNAPRFLREGDKFTFTAKVSNLSAGDLNGSAQLLLFDALTMKPIDDLFKNKQAIIDFDAKKGQSAKLSWEIEVPEGIGAVTYRVVAKANNFTDGEEMVLPILSNRMLVTESLPLPSKGIGTKEFTFTKLTNSGSSSSIKHHKLTLEYTSNPAWYAVQAIPYMMEYPYECAEQIFTRYYSNAIASNIVNSNPKIKQIFESWKQSSPDAFLSNLEKNQELKAVMLEETPWVLDAQNESERKKRVGLLFDLNKMDNELQKTITKLQKMQVSNGGWPWFPGMEDSRYITQHIITGMGHLDNLGVKNVRQDPKVWKMVQNGVSYLDMRIIEDYEWLKKKDPNYLTEQRISQLQVQYLYARSYFKDIPMNDRLKAAFDYYQNQAATYWKNFNIYNEGMIALQAHRYASTTLSNQIMASLKERALVHEELGMYWKDNISGYYWYQAPIETQALMIEAFDEITNDQPVVEELKVWLLKQKQTTDWKTTKATVEACYALLLRGTDLLMNDEQVDIKINGKLIDPKALGTKVEAGTGYFKTSWSGSEVLPEMGNISVTRTTAGVSWGAMYWQYFEDLDKITPHESPLKLNKKLFLVKNTASGPVISPVTSETILKPGDKIRVRIELRSDRDMEYVHMKDMRAAGLEPINVFSRYKWQDGLGYYESTKDAATNFFMDYLPKGTYVFEYDLRVSQTGDFSNGITTIQSMYAPEFSSHSEGVRVKIGVGE